MKTCMQAKGLMMLSIMMTIAVTISAQRMYKHPRVTLKTNKFHLNKNKAKAKEAEKLIMPATITVLEEEIVANTEIESLEHEVTVASTETKVAVKNVRKNLVKSFEMKDVKNVFDFTTYGQQLTEHSRLMKVKKVQKTALESWLLWMIILFAAALAFSILAVIFGVALFSTASLALSTIFWIFAGLCWFGGIIVLILGIAGII